MEIIGNSWGWGVLKVKILEAKYEAKLKFPGGDGGAKQKTFRGGSMDIFWNCTIPFLSFFFFFFFSFSVFFLSVTYPRTPGVVWLKQNFWYSMTLSNMRESQTNKVTPSFCDLSPYYVIVIMTHLLYLDKPLQWLP